MFTAEASGTNREGAKALQRSTRLVGFILDRLLAAADAFDATGSAASSAASAAVTTGTTGERPPPPGSKAADRAPAWAGPAGPPSAPSSVEGRALLAEWEALALGFLGRADSTFAEAKSSSFVLALQDLLAVVLDLAARAVERGIWAVQVPPPHDLVALLPNTICQL